MKKGFFKIFFIMSLSQAGKQEFLKFLYAVEAKLRGSNSARR